MNELTRQGPFAFVRIVFGTVRIAAVFERLHDRSEVSASGRSGAAGL